MADEPKFGQRHEDVERKLSHYYVFSLKELRILHQERRQLHTIVMEHFNSIAIHKSRPAKKPHIYQF